MMAIKPERKVQLEAYAEDHAARVLALAERVFADREKALTWMRRPKKRFRGEVPMALLQTEAGARLVEQVLIQIDEGMFA